jgi:peptidase E
MIANAGEEITFSIESTNLPEGAGVYLEDKKTGVFTNLSESTYTTPLTEAANRIGQFYIHTAGKALNTTDLNIENISVYKSSSNEITITGLNTEATFTMFYLLGKQVL